MRGALVLFLTCAACSGGAAAVPPSARGHAAAPPEIRNGRLADGPRPRLGCFAWSRTEHTAACITGGGPAEEPVYLAILDGRTQATVLPPTLDAAAAVAANEMLAQRGFDAITIAPRPFAIGASFDVGGAKISFTKRPYPPDPRRTIFQVAADCRGDHTNVTAIDLGTEVETASIRIYDDRALIETTIRDVAAVPSTESLGAVVFDAAACSTLSQRPDDV